MEALALIPEASEALNRAYDVLNDLVRAARGAGATWQAIGDAVGCSRQVAHYRWHRLDEQAPDAAAHAE